MSTCGYEEFLRSARDFVLLSERLGDGWELRTSRGETFMVKKCALPFPPPGSRDGDCSSNWDDGFDAALDGGEDLCGTVEMVEDTCDPATLTETSNKVSTTNSTASKTTCSEQTEQLGVKPSTSGSEGLVHQDPSSHAQQQETVKMEYHVVYNISYGVPVLLFTAYHLNGKQLRLEEIWSLISPAHAPPSNQEKWNMVSQLEHHILGRPFYHIHPCHTAKAMEAAATARFSPGRSSDAKEQEVGDVKGEKSCCGDKLGRTGPFPNYILTWLSMFGPVVGLTLPLEYGKM